MNIRGFNRIQNKRYYHKKLGQDAPTLRSYDLAEQMTEIFMVDIRALCPL